MRISDWSSDVCSSDLCRACQLGERTSLRYLAGDETDHVGGRQVLALIVLDELIDAHLFDVVGLADDRADLHSQLPARTPAPLAEHDPIAPIFILGRAGDRLKMAPLLARLGHPIDRRFADRTPHVPGTRSEARPVGKAGVQTCRSRWATHP